MNTVWLFIFLLATPLNLLSGEAASIENVEYDYAMARQKGVRKSISDIIVASINEFETKKKHYFVQTV